jgi:DNA polymerase III epsilon subunit-like protein
MLSYLSKKSFPVLSPVPASMTYILTFDVETTGLLPKMDPVSKKMPDMSEYPYITQFSWVLYNLKTNMFEDVKNHYIRLPEGVRVSPEITELTGITQEMCDGGVSISSVLATFYELLLTVDVVVAHNLQFDGTVINTELLRHRDSVLGRLKAGTELPLNLFSEEFTNKHNVSLYCTMLASKDICNLWVEPKPRAAPGAVPSATAIPPPVILPVSSEPAVDTSQSDASLIILPRRSPSPGGARKSERVETRPSVSYAALGEEPEKEDGAPVSSPTEKKTPAPRMYKKYPKLSELHAHLFGDVPEHLHNALVDTLVCLRCFLKIRCAFVLSSRKFELILQRYSRGHML